MTTVSLELVESALDIQQSLDNFNTSFLEDLDLVQSLIRTTSFWVYDAASKNFGLSKFVGFKNMTLTRYQSARNGNVQEAKFDGHVTRKAIEGILGPYALDSHLSGELVQWADSLMGAGIFEGIDDLKWQFVSL